MEREGGKGERKEGKGREKGILKAKQGSKSKKNMLSL